MKRAMRVREPAPIRTAIVGVAGAGLVAAGALSFAIPDHAATDSSCAGKDVDEVCEPTEGSYAAAFSTCQETTSRPEKLVCTSSFEALDVLLALSRTNALSMRRSIVVAVGLVGMAMSTVRMCRTYAPSKGRMAVRPSLNLILASVGFAASFFAAVVPLVYKRDPISVDSLLLMPAVPGSVSGRLFTTRQGPTDWCEPQLGAWKGSGGPIQSLYRDASEGRTNGMESLLVDMSWSGANQYYPRTIVAAVNAETLDVLWHSETCQQTVVGRNWLAIRRYHDLLILDGDGVVRSAWFMGDWHAEVSARDDSLILTTWGSGRLGEPGLEATYHPATGEIQERWIPPRAELPESMWQPPIWPVYRELVLGSVTIRQFGTTVLAHEGERLLWTNELGPLAELHGKLYEGPASGNEPVDKAVILRRLDPRTGAVMSELTTDGTAKTMAMP